MVKSELCILNQPVGVKMILYGNTLKVITVHFFHTQRVRTLLNSHILTYDEIHHRLYENGVWYKTLSQSWF